MRKLLTLMLGLLAAAVVVPTTAGASPPPAASGRTAAVTVDGMRLGWLPTGLGRPSDFAYEFDDVAFVSRDWESRSATGGWRVDLSVDVLRGATLADGRSMHDWVIAYEERPPGEVTYHRATVRGRPAWQCADELFWLVRPGVAMVVRHDAERFAAQDLQHVARAVRELPAA